MLAETTFDLNKFISFARLKNTGWLKCPTSMLPEPEVESGVTLVTVLKTLVPVEVKPSHPNNFC